MFPELSPEYELVKQKVTQREEELLRNGSNKVAVLLLSLFLRAECARIVVEWILIAGIWGIIRITDGCGVKTERRAVGFAIVGFTY